VIRMRVEPELGGRIASIIDAAGHERLWRRDDPRRARVQPGDGFIDAGGVEECFPDLVEPDHGDAWSRAWRRSGDALAVETGSARLRRTISVDDGGFTARYEVEAAPGTPFVWAFHALLIPEEGLTICPAGGGEVRSWPSGWDQPARSDRWPVVGDERRFDIAGADDGSAVFALLPGVRSASVRSSLGMIRTTLEVDDEQPIGLGIWRNLGGWPAAGPYRSWGVEPMIGWDPRRDRRADEVGCVRSGRLGWSLRVDIADDGH